MLNPTPSHQFILRAIKTHENKYNYSKVNFLNYNEKVVIICPIHGEFLQRPRNHVVNKQGCPKCGYAKCNKNNTKTLSDFISAAEKIHEGKYDYRLVEYKNTHNKIAIICNIHGQFSQTPNNHLHNHGCPKCALEFKSIKSRQEKKDFCKKANLIHKNKYLYRKSEYINRRVKIIITCPSHGDFKVTPNAHLAGVGCTRCSKTYKRTNSEFIKECSEIHNGKYDYSMVDFKTTGSKVIIICPIHDKFFQTASHHLMGIGCPLCGESKGEKLIEKFLRKFNVKYIRQHKFDDCKNKYSLPFDFYLPELRACIEFDGLQHFKPNRLFGGEKAFLLTQKRDEIKNDYCRSKNIRLLRIKYGYEKYAEEILKSFLHEVE